MYDKRIVYDRSSRDFMATLNGELIGYYGSYHAAEVALNELVFSLLQHSS